MENLEAAENRHIRPISYSSATKVIARAAGSSSLFTIGVRYHLHVDEAD